MSFVGGENPIFTCRPALALTSKVRFLFLRPELDSWWYYKDATNSGVLKWIPRPDVFPAGFGFDLGLPLVLHNRFWSPNNPYMTQYPFFYDGNGKVAVPASHAFFHEEVMKDPASRWSMLTYEQDFLEASFQEDTVMQSNVTAGRTWLRAMDQAALSFNASVQYCMSLPRYILQSASLRSVLSARVSQDYNP